jgi:hypothetical protein
MDQNKEMAMFSFDVRKILSVTIAVAAICCLAAPGTLAAAGPQKSADVTFTATGTFAATQVSGADTLKMAGQPFTISVVANSSLKPIQHGQNWAIFKPLVMSGTVYSGLIPNQAIPIGSSTAALDQTVGASEDIFQSGFPVVVIGIALNVRAYITLPGGTLASALIRPFASVALNSTNATVTYSNSTASTVLAVDNGTISATLPVSGGAQTAFTSTPSAFLLLAGAPAVKPRGPLAISL